MLGAGTSGGVTLSYRAGKAVAPIASPASAFTTAFGGVSSGSISSGGTVSTTDAALKRRQSILDVVSKEINDVKGRVGASEKAKLDAHLDSIRALENKLTQTSGGGTTGGTNPNATKACAALAKPTDSSSIIANDLLHLDILVNALACDVTRVGVMQFGSDQALQACKSTCRASRAISTTASFTRGRVRTSRGLIAFEAWLATQFANVVTNLKSKQIRTAVAVLCTIRRWSFGRATWATP